MLNIIKVTNSALIESMVPSEVKSSISSSIQKLEQLSASMAANNNPIYNTYNNQYPQYAPAPPPSAPVQWVCDVCKVSVFSNYEEAKRHEAYCRLNQVEGGQQKCKAVPIGAVKGSSPTCTPVKNPSMEDVYVRDSLGMCNK